MVIQVKPGECVGMEWYEYVLRAEVSWTSAYILVYDGAKRRRYQAQHYKKIDCYSIKKRKDITGIVSYRSLVACMDHVVTLCWLVCEDRCVIILVSQDYKMPYVRHRCVLQVENVIQHLSSGQPKVEIEIFQGYFLCLDQYRMCAYYHCFTCLFLSMKGEGNWSIVVLPCLSQGMHTRQCVCEIASIVVGYCYSHDVSIVCVTSKCIRAIVWWRCCYLSQTRLDMIVLVCLTRDRVNLCSCDVRGMLERVHLPLVKWRLERWSAVLSVCNTKSSSKSIKLGKIGWSYAVDVCACDGG